MVLDASVSGTHGQYAARFIASGSTMLSPAKSNAD